MAFALSNMVLLFLIQVCLLWLFCDTHAGVKIYHKLLEDRENSELLQSFFNYRVLFSDGYGMLNSEFTTDTI